MIVIAYYTSGNYKKVAESHLIPSLKWWKLKYDIQEVPEFANWQEATGYKSKFILEMLKKHKEPVCYIDVDAYVLRYPELLFNIPEEYDLAYHNLDRFLQWNITSPHRYELVSGTLFLRYNEKVIQLLELWQANVQKEIFTMEQLVLQRIMTKPHDYKVFPLPAEYCTILIHDNTIPKYVKEPVILHCQASRKFKRGRKGLTPME